MNKSERVPAALQSKYDEIVGLTDQCCQAHLTDEYRDLCRTMAAKLCRKRPSPVTTGKVSTWACAIVYAIGKVNFLFDKNQAPYLRADALCQHFGVSTSNASAKAKIIMDALRINGLSPDWTLPSRLADNPLVWIIQVNGLVIDARYAPRAIQEEAFRLGIIPYLPS